MLTTFPKRLEVPIEPAFLRLLVRRRRQNQNKRVKKEGSESASVTTVATPIKKEKKPNVMKLQIPQASQKFPTITYNVAHFVVTAVEKWSHSCATNTWGNSSAIVSSKEL